MANGYFDTAVDAAANGGINWSTGAFWLMVIDAYTFNYTHATRQAILDSGADVIATVALADTETYTGHAGAGRGGAADIATVAPPLGKTIRRLVVTSNHGNQADPATNPELDIPLLYWDQNDDGSDIIRAGDGTIAPIQWSASLKMFKIG